MASIAIPFVSKQSSTLFNFRFGITVETIPFSHGVQLGIPTDLAKVEKTFFFLFCRLKIFNDVNSILPTKISLSHFRRLQGLLMIITILAFVATVYPVVLSRLRIPFLHLEGYLLSRPQKVSSLVHSTLTDLKTEEIVRRKIEAWRSKE